MLLLYCMTQDDVPSPCRSQNGVNGAEILDVAKNGVRYFYSQWHPARSADEVKQQALEFHRTNQKILEHTTLIPFRFPTSVANDAELAELMEAQSSEYALELHRLQGMVQMKVAVEGGSHASVTASSGTEYLKQKQIANAPMNSAIEEIKRAAAQLVTETKQRRRGNGVALFFLLQRERVDQLRAVLQGLQTFSAKVTFSGPWPPSEFVNCYPDVQAKRI